MNIRLKPIEDQVVVIIGASSGIGRETALQFARRGAKLVIVARNDEALESLHNEILQLGGTATPVVADTTDPEQMKAVAGQAIAAYGRIDTWAHIAGASIYARFIEHTPEEFRQVVETNLLGQVYGAMAAIPYMRQNGGALIHVSSMVARVAVPLQSAYSSSKHGMSGFIKAMRLELIKDKVPISVTEVLPAAINTPFFNHARTKLGVKPMGMPPFYQPKVVAEAIVRAAETPMREVYAGGASKLFTLMQRFAPRLTDLFLLNTGFKGQQTDEPKSALAPATVFEPVRGDTRIEGDFSEQAIGSVYTRVQTSPAARRGTLLASILGGAAVVATRLRRS
jgi:NAD(P)-dependent dehydrogenase (short-subunit alcohol dehydrogenase family)